jgi:transcriptional regulator with XRE-family HTH domain
MFTQMDKRDRARLLRERLIAMMNEREMNQTALARAVGVDRSTISQLLSGPMPRLPNAQVIAGCAVALGVSADWLLGLSQRRERAAEVVAASLSITAAPRAMADEQILSWHREAAGYKIRHVPAALPDMLKTPQMLRWEYAPHLGRSPDQIIGASEDRLDWMRASRSDYELAMPLYELASFVRGEGYYEGLPPEIRQAQIRRLLELHDQLYPTLRIFLFDARRIFSAPVTVFGPLMAVLYIGQSYLSFRDSERVSTFTRHFDLLVREAAVEARDFPRHLAALAQQDATAQ